MSWFSAAVRSSSERFFGVRTTERAGEIEASLLAADYKDKFEQVLDEINDLSEDTLTPQDLNNLKNIFTKNHTSVKQQQLDDLELFKGNLQLIKEMKTSFSHKDVLSIKKSQIKFGAYEYKSSSSGNNTFVGWYKNNALVYGKKIVKYGEGRRSESGEFKLLDLNPGMYALETGTVTIEKNEILTEIQIGEFKFDQILSIVKGTINKLDTGEILSGDFESTGLNTYLVSGKDTKSDGTTMEGQFKYYHEIGKVVLCDGIKVDHNKTTSTLKVKFEFGQEGELFFEGNIKKHTQDGYLTTYEGLFRYELESREHILVQGKKTLPDGTIYDGKFYWDMNLKKEELLEGTIKYQDRTTEKVPKEEISNRKV